MNVRLTGWIFSACSILVLAGCGGGTGQSAGQGESKSGVTGVPGTQSGRSPTEEEEVGEPPLEATASPAEVVTFFLNSLRSGDKVNVAATLTKKARTETSKEGLVVQPIGTPDAKYEVGSVEYVGARKDGAHVQSIWTEVDSEGTSNTYDVIWVLRKQDTGWRIAGMATQVAEGEAPEFLNFENPREMLDKIEESSGATASKDDARTRKGTR